METQVDLSEDLTAAALSKNLNCLIEKHDMIQVEKLVDEMNASTKETFLDPEFHITGGIKLALKTEQETNTNEVAEKGQGMNFIAGNSLRKEKSLELSDALDVQGTKVPSAAQLIPGRFVLNLIHMARDSGVRFVTNAKVLSIKREENKDGEKIYTLQVELKQLGSTLKLHLTCEHLVHASNGYGLNLLPRQLQPLVTAKKAQCIAIRLLDEKHDDLFRESVSFKFFSGSFGEYLIRRQEDKIVILGGCRHKSEGFGEMKVLTSSQYEPDEKVEKAVAEELISQFALLTGDAPFEVVSQWCGTMCFTEDFKPIVGPVEEICETRKASEFVAIGYSGHGMTRAYCCGRHIAELLLGEQPTLPEIGTAYRVGRFQDAKLAS